VDNFGPEHEPKRIALCDWGELFFYWLMKKEKV
jgi:hypothetical protein